MNSLQLRPWIYCIYHSYEAEEDNELSFHVGDKIVEIDVTEEDWWQGRHENGNVGLFPGEFICHDSCRKFHGDILYSNLCGGAGVRSSLQ
jgi:hypothetical protein